mmetsp:Transcript_4389/g.9759  ORF Transcript_4389/g.9759 Transcript_4389/m.9759 type:complete len:626 (+) Transcript_4389:105-1982(+)
MMRVLSNVPSSSFIGRGYCLDEQYHGVRVYNDSSRRFYVFWFTFSCYNCPASKSPETCASSCWDIQETYLNPLEEDIITPGYVYVWPDGCVCLSDTNDAFGNGIVATPIELSDVEELTGFKLSWNRAPVDMGPITNSTGLINNSEFCFAFDLDANNETETTSAPGSDPSSIFVGKGRCLDDQGSTGYSRVYCSGCPASLSRKACSASCWDIQQTYIDPLEQNLLMVGFLLEGGYCECLLDLNGAFMDDDDFPFDEFDEIVAQTDFFYKFGRKHDMGPITDTITDTSRRPSSAWCYAFDFATTCVDRGYFIDQHGNGCEWYINEKRCNDCLLYTNNGGRNACESCCKCGGGWHRGDSDPNSTNDDSDKFLPGAAQVFAAAAIIFLLVLAVALHLSRSRRTQSAAPTQGQSSQPSPEHSAPTEDQLLSDFEAKLAATSMIVSKKNIIRKEPTLQKTSFRGDFDNDQDSGDTTTFSSTVTRQGEEEEIVVPPMQDIELGTDDNDGNFSPPGNNKGVESMRSDAEHTWVLQLPRTTDSHQQQKQVSCVCAICLSAYKVDETVSWAAMGVENTTTQGSTSSSSSHSGCPHAFHTACIVKYAKTSTASQTNSTVVPCPLCRQPFVGTANSS